VNAAQARHLAVRRLRGVANGRRRAITVGR
jgi:hypothetical protein